MSLDAIMNEYIKQKEVFADLVNLYLDPVKNRMEACHFVDADPTYPDRRRDILKEGVIKENEQNRFVIFGIENQSEMDPSMPVRVMGYDIREYERQIRKEKQKQSRKILQKGEFLSGVKKEIRIKPVITIVLFGSGEKWEGAKSLSEMMEVLGKEMMEIFNDYHLHIIEPYKLKEKEIRKCNSGMREILKVLKYSGEKEKMIEYLKRKGKRKIDEPTAKVIEAITKIPMKSEEKGGKIDMCKATEEYTKECIEIGKKEAEFKIAKRMMESGSFSLDSIELATGLSKQALQNLKNQILVKA